MLLGDYDSAWSDVADIYMYEVTDGNAARTKGVGLVVHVVTRDGPGPDVFSPPRMRADPSPKYNSPTVRD
jgi:hypothetical protein